MLEKKQRYLKVSGMLRNRRSVMWQVCPFIFPLQENECNGSLADQTTHTIEMQYQGNIQSKYI